MSRSSSIEVAVLGGGLVGTSLAYELASAGATVTLIDAPRSGRASDAGAGILSPETFIEPDDDWFSFGRNAAQHLRSLVVRLAEDGAGPGPEVFTECGSLVLALAQHEDQWFAEISDRASARNSDVVEIPATDAREMFPPLGTIWRALHNPHAARVDGRALTAHLRTAAQRRGVTMISTEAVRVERRGDRVTTVVGTYDSVPCDALVLAGGAWTAHSARWFGIELPITPTKGQIVHLLIPGGDESGGGGINTARWPILQPVVNFYLVPWPGGRVACGGTFEPNAGFDARPTVGGIRDLLRECIAIAPGLLDATLLEVRVGLRPTSADDRPLLGQLPGATNVHVCAGHGANGLLLGPYSAALVADGLLSTPASELAQFRVSRFSDV